MVNLNFENRLSLNQIRPASLKISWTQIILILTSTFFRLGFLPIDSWNVERKPVADVETLCRSADVEPAAYNTGIGRVYLPVATIHNIRKRRIIHHDRESVINIRVVFRGILRVRDTTHDTSATRLARTITIITIQQQ